MKNPSLANESWDRFLPKFKKTNVKRRKFKVKERAVFPPPPTESKVSQELVKQAHISTVIHTQVDKELTSGEYFLKQQKRRKVTRICKWLSFMVTIFQEKNQS